MKNCKIVLKQKKEESLLRFHPWVFSGAVASIEGKPTEGDIVEVFSANNHFLGIGHYQMDSITVRILSFTPVRIDLSFWTDRIRQAYVFRRSLGLDVLNDIYRLVHGEGDGLSGLIIDVYAHTAVIQAHSAGMHHARQEIAAALREVFGNQIHRIYYKSEGTLPYKADLHEENEYLWGGDINEPPVATENGLKFNIDWMKGHKIG